MTNPNPKTLQNQSLQNEDGIIYQKKEKELQENQNSRPILSVLEKVIIFLK